MKKITGWKTKGMNRDISVSAFNNEFSFENINLRVMTNEGNTALSWVNEKGTAQISIVNRNGELEIWKGDIRIFLEGSGGEQFILLLAASLTPST